MAQMLSANAPIQTLGNSSAEHLDTSFSLFNAIRLLIASHIISLVKCSSVVRKKS